MVSDLYVFDLETFRWERIPVSPDDDIPQPRYFHSADACQFSCFLTSLRLTLLQGTITSSFSVA